LAIAKSATYHRFVIANSEKMNLKIQKANIEDAEVLTQLMRKSKGYWEYSTEQLEKWKEELKISEEYIAENNTFKLSLLDKCIGFYSFKQNGENLKLDNLFIRPNAIGKGYGKILLQDFLKKARSISCKRVLLESDPNAEPFYKKHNFNTIALQETSIRNRFMPIMVWAESQIGKIRIFNTQRLYVRNLESADIDEFHKMQSNENVMRYIKPIMDYEESKKELDRFIGYYKNQIKMFRIWALIEKETDKFIGICGVYLNDKYETEIAYRLQQINWGKGYGTEIAKELIDFCFNTLEYDKLFAYAREGNLGSRKILSKMMNYQGTSIMKEKLDHIYSVERKNWL